MAEEGPTGYYVGRPMNHDDQKTKPASQAADEKVNDQVPGYYAGRVPGKKPAAGSAADQPAKEPGFFASCFGCFSGSKTVG